MFYAERSKKGRKRMRGMRKSRLYRGGAAFLAALIVFTGMPQTLLYASASEVVALADQDNAADGEDSQDTSEPEKADDAHSGQDGTDTGIEDEGKDGDAPNIDGQIEDDDRQTGQDQDDTASAEEEEEPDETVMPAAEEDEGDSEPDKPEFKIDYNTVSVQVKDKRYDGKPHSLRGYPVWDFQEVSPTFTFEVTGTTEAGNSYTNDTTQAIAYANVSTDFAAAYDRIAPTEAGSYTLEISAEIDNPAYKYEKSPQRFPFVITHLHSSSMKLTGVSGINDKTYDGKSVDFSSQIGNAKVKTENDVEIAGTGELSFTIEKRDDDSGEYEEVEGMPSQTGKYRLVVTLAEGKSYDKTEWEFPFEIKSQALTITVKDQEMYVGDEALKAGDPLPENRYPLKDQYEIEGLVEGNKTEFENDLKIVVTQDVDSDKTGIYDLAVDGIDEEKWSDYEITWTGAKLTVKGLLHSVDGNLKGVTNIKNGTTLADIAKLLPKQTTIYLYSDGKAPVTSGGSGSTAGSGG